jgi:hypothetical protein
MGGGGGWGGGGAQLDKITNRPYRAILTSRGYFQKTWGLKPKAVYCLYTMVVKTHNHLCNHHVVTKGQAEQAEKIGLSRNNRHMKRLLQLQLGSSVGSFLFIWVWG